MNKKVVFGLIGIGLIGFSLFIPIVDDYSFFDLANSFVILLNILLISASLFLLYQDKYQYLWIVGLLIVILHFYTSRVNIGPFLSRSYYTGQISDLNANVGAFIFNTLGAMILIILSIIYKRKEIKKILSDN